LSWCSLTFWANYCVCFFYCIIKKKKEGVPVNSTEKSTLRSFRAARTWVAEFLSLYVNLYTIWLSIYVYVYYIHLNIYIYIIINMYIFVLWWIHPYWLFESHANLYCTYYLCASSMTIAVHLISFKKVNSCCTDSYVVIITSKWGTHDRPLHTYIYIYVYIYLCIYIYIYIYICVYPVLVNSEHLKESLSSLAPCITTVFALLRSSNSFCQCLMMMMMFT
jgi:hypothetical protein